MKKMLGLVLAVVMVLSMGGFALADYGDYNSEDVVSGGKQSVLFTVYTQVELPCFLEVTLEGNVVGAGQYPKVTIKSQGADVHEKFDSWKDYAGYPGTPDVRWYMTFHESSTSPVVPVGTTPPKAGKWLYDCGQSEPPKWHLIVKATDTWRFYLLGGDLGNQDGQKIRIQRKVTGATTLDYGNMRGGGEANKTEASLKQLGPDNSANFATMRAQWIYTGTNTGGTEFWFRYRIPHEWTTPQGYYEGVIGYLVIAYE